MAHLGEKDFYDRDLVRTAGRENIMKGLYGDDIFKAEGDRGGKIVGHTKSGKPTYPHSAHQDHKNFTKQDHLDAAELHGEHRFRNSKFDAFHKEAHLKLAKESKKD